MNVSSKKIQAARRAWPLAGVAAATILALTACGGGGGGGSGPPAAATSKWGNATAASVTVSTLALTGPGTPLVKPLGIVADGSGGFYVTENNSSTLKRISSTGVVTQLNAAAGDGMLNLYGGNLYVAASADTIQRCTTAGVCTVVANNGGTLYDIVFSSTGDAFISSFSNGNIYKVPASALVAATAASPVDLSTAGYCYAGCGAGTPITLTATTTYPVAASNVDASSLGGIVGLALDANNNLYAAGWGMHVVYKITPAGQLSVLAGSYGTPGFADGMGTAAKFDRPYDLLTDAVGNVLLTDRGNHRVRLIKPDGTVSTLSGTGTPGSTDGAGTGATHNTPVGIALGDDGNVYVVDNGSSKIRKLVTP